MRPSVIMLAVVALILAGAAVLLELSCFGLKANYPHVVFFGHHGLDVVHK